MMDDGRGRQSPSTRHRPSAPSARPYTALDRDLADQTCALISKLQELGLVRGDVDGRGVGEMIFNSMNMMFIEFIKREDMPIKALRADIKRQNRTLIAAISS